MWYNVRDKRRGDWYGREERTGQDQKRDRGLYWQTDTAENK